MAEEIVIDTRGNNIVVDMPERLIGFDIEDQTGADNLWPTNCQRQMIHWRASPAPIS